MKQLLPLAALGLLAAAPATAATRNYTVTSFDRVRIEGPFAVTLTTNVAPFARATGSNQAIDAISLRVEGTTLIVQANRSAWTGFAAPAGPATIAIGTHDLNSASASGAGSIAIDKVRGLTFTLILAGAAQGSIALADVDQFRLTLAGTGSARLGGKAGTMTAIVNGAGALDASALKVKDLTLTALGPTSVQVTASNSAKITAGGAATVTVAGKPACTVDAMGSASVSGCR
ncbi:MAG: DUF2807 domain-containing protein [Sphingomicrobium sp.]